MFRLVMGAALIVSAASGASLDEQLAKWKRVEMPYHPAGLSVRQQKMVEKLVQACRYLDDIYWRQSDPEGLKLLGSTTDPKLKQFLMVNGSRWDLIDENRPFTGRDTMPPGRALYPRDLTRDEIEAYVKQHPKEKDALYSGYTVVKRQGAKLIAVPFHKEYKAQVVPMARALREAAALSDDPAFAKFLRMRAGACLTDDYFPSDLAWLELKDPKIDVIFAPYETYLDELLGVKTTWGGSVLIRNDEESNKLAVYQKYVPEIQDALPLAATDRPSKRGHATPMEVCDAPFRAGDLRHGYQAVADNLPNDPRIHEQKGSKKIFFKNFMDARVDNVILPVAQVMLRADQAARVSGEGYLAGTLLHEIAHGLGPAFARMGGKQVDIREAVGGVYAELEEAKADVAGMFGLEWLMEHGAMPGAKSEEYYASYVAGLFRTLRFGTGEAHGRAEMMECNYLLEHKALARGADGKYVLDYARMPGVLAALAKELLEIEATGDRARVEKWFAKYSAMPAELKAALDKTGGIPVDVDPVFSFPEEVR